MAIKSFERELECMLECMVDVAQEATRVIKHTRQSKKSTRKKDKTILTNGDLRSSEKIREMISARFPEYGLIIEEENRDYKEDLEKEKIFVWDPLDGSRVVGGGLGEDYGVIGGSLVKIRGVYVPVAGVTVNIPKGEIVYARMGAGAFYRKGERSYRMLMREPSDFSVVVSSSRRSPELQRILEQLEVEPDQVRLMSSSLKAIEVAMSRASLYVCPRESPMSLWDLCGIDLIVREAKGRFTDLSGEQFDYQELIKNPTNRRGVLVGSKVAHKYALERIRQLEE